MAAGASADQFALDEWLAAASALLTTGEIHVTFQHRRCALAAALLIFAAPLMAQPEASADVATTASPNAPAEAIDDVACCTIPKMTVVEIEILDRVNSRLNHAGEQFAIRLAEPLIFDGRVVAPAGTTGVGEVVHAARARAGGKAGELILAARYLELAGAHVSLRSLRYGRSQGTDNSGAVNVGNMVAAAVLPVASVVGFLITGGEVDIPAGTRANARLAADTRLSPID
jgi:hypothetical protein